MAWESLLSPDGRLYMSTLSSTGPINGSDKTEGSALPLITPRVAGSRGRRKVVAARLGSQQLGDG